MFADYHLNGFSSLDYTQKSAKLNHPCKADNLAHFLLHAYLMSPILNAWHHNIIRYIGLTPWQCAPGARFPYPSQLKD
ncbi:hypothetical protein [[Enterobacter] lignolyticus]|uniref:protein YnhH n=1 Tax=[Enterobacter] lignolyticus TaxID=1334193 RepID=UPI003B834D7E